MKALKFYKSRLDESRQLTSALFENAADILGKLSAIINSGKAIRNLAIAANLYNPEDNSNKDTNFVAALIVGIDKSIKLIEAGSKSADVLVNYLRQAKNEPYSSPAVRLATIAREKFADEVERVAKMLQNYERNKDTSILQMITRLRIASERIIVQQKQRVNPAPAAVGFN